MYINTPEYDVLMQAINNYRDELREDGLSNYPDMTLAGKNAETMLIDLFNVEGKVMSEHFTDIPY